MTWTILLEPGHGRIGVGQWDGGQSCEHLIEADLAWDLAGHAADELRRAAVRHFVLSDVRQGDGVLLAHRADACPDNGTLVSLHFESLTKSGINGGRVYAGAGEQSMALAERLAAVVGSWGQTTCNRYRGCDASADHAYPHLRKSTITSVLVSPFSVTAPDAILYARRLQTLGHLIASTLAMWALGRNPAIRCYQPLTSQRDVARGPAAQPMGLILAARGESPQTNNTARRVSVRSPTETSE
jgi:hypothetical protein